MPVVLVPDCFQCANMIGVNPEGGWRCDAFERIPVDILASRRDHTTAYEGDKGIRYKRGEPVEVVRADAEFKESDHPRDEDGKFTSGGGGNSLRRSESIRSVEDLKTFASEVRKLPPDDDKHEYYYHSVRHRDELECILENGLKAGTDGRDWL